LSHATTEPRIITYRDAFGRALHQLAIAQEQAGNISAALAAHEHASKVGWRASTVVLRRWFLEGHTAVEVDLTRAQQLEALASHQQEIAWWDIPTKSRSSGDVSTETVYLEEPESNALPIADEIFRLRRFQDVEITREGEQLIKRIYDLAQTNKESVAGLLERSRRERRRNARRSVSDAIDAHKLLKDGKLEDATRALLRLGYSNTAWD
jgi:hypothetical protein